MANAWDAQTHIALCQAAARISGIPRSRIPAENWDAFLQGVGEPDLMDKNCVYHRGPEARPEAWARATKLHAQLRGPNGLSPRQRAFALGQLLHYTQDCLIPRSILGKISPSQAVGLGFHDLVIYREARPLGEPLERALRDRAEEALWYDEREEVNAAVFRHAANLTVDLLLTLPPLDANAAAVSDSGPVVFIPAHVVTEQVVPGRVEEDVEKLLLPDLHLVEWAPHTDPSTGVGSARALFVNNLDVSVGELLIRSGKWMGRVNVDLPPHNLRVVQLQGPPLSPDDTVGVFVCGPRALERPAAGARSTRTRIIGEATRAGLPKMDVFREVKVPVRNPGGQSLDSILSALGGLRLSTFTCTSTTFGTRCRLSVTNEAEPRPTPLILDFESVDFESGGALSYQELILDVSGLPIGGQKAVDTALLAGRKKLAGQLYRIVGARRPANGRK